MVEMTWVKTYVKLFGIRWQLDLHPMSGPAFGSVRAHAPGPALRAAVLCFRTFGEVIGMVRRAHADIALLEELARDIWWPSWWDSRPIAAHLQDVRAALRSDPIASAVVHPAYEAVFTSALPQAMTVHALEAGLRPERAVRAAGQRMARFFDDLSVEDARWGVTSALLAGAGLQPHYVMVVLKSSVRLDTSVSGLCVGCPEHVWCWLCGSDGLAALLCFRVSRFSAGCGGGG